MGWACDRYFDEWDAQVSRDDLEVHFERLYTDTRDMMCDDLNPHWAPVDKFIITIDSFKFWKETQKGNVSVTGTPYVMTVEHRDPIRRIVIRVENKNAANLVWKMAKNGAPLSDIYLRFRSYVTEDVNYN